MTPCRYYTLSGHSKHLMITLGCQCNDEDIRLDHKNPIIRANQRLSP